MVRHLMAILALILLLRTGSSSADEFACGTSAPPDSSGGGQQSPPAPSDYDDLGLIFHRYIPPTGHGALDLEFTYSGAIRDSFSDGSVEERTAALHAALDALASKLCDEVDNSVGSNWTDFEFLHNWYGGDDAVTYPYGHSHYSDPSNGGRNFYVQYRNGSTPSHPSNLNHVDIVFRRLSESYTLDDHDSVTLGGYAGQWREPNIPGFPSDLGETFAAGAPEYYYRNGVQVSVVPKAPEWKGYYELVHELGHLFDLNETGSPRDPWHVELIPQVGCGFARTYPDDPKLESGYVLPFIFGEVSLWSGTVYPAMEPDGVHARYAYGGIWGAYFYPHFHQPTGGAWADGLLRRLRDIGLSSSSDDYYWGRYPALLEHASLDDMDRYPYLQDAGTPMTGEERLERIFTNFATALAVNAPHIASGQYGFPGGFQPAENWSYFRDNDDVAGADSIPNAMTIPPPFSVTLSDSIRTTVRSSIPYPDRPMDLKLKLYPWTLGVFEINLADDIDDLGAGTYVEFALVGTNALFTHPASGYEHSLGACLALYPDIGDTNIWAMGEEVIRIKEPAITTENGIATISCRIPADGHIRNAALVVTLMESGMPEAWVNNDHIRWGAIQTTAPGWGYEIQYEVKTTEEDPLEPAFANHSFNSQINTGEGLPTGSVPIAFGDDDYMDLLIGIAGDDAQLLENQALAGQDSRFGSNDQGLFANSSPPYDVRSFAVADIDNDGKPGFFAASENSPSIYLSHTPTGSETHYFRDISPQTQVGTVGTDSWSGAWGDYDGDGWVDLYICRADGEATPTGIIPMRDTLLRNRGRRNIGQSNEYVGFLDITTAGDLCSFDTYSTTASWADFDEDGDLDLAVGSLPEAPVGPGPRTGIYLNDGLGDFDEDHAGIGLGSVGYVSGLLWADIDGDTDLDLLMSRHVSSPPGPQVTLLLAENDGSGTLTLDAPYDEDPDQSMIGVRVADVDLDGILDILGIPEDATKPPALYLNDGSGGNYLSEYSGMTGLADGAAAGMTFADFNTDGDPDLYTGRVAPGYDFFFENVLNYRESNAFVQVRPYSTSGGNNGIGLGSTVRVVAGTDTYEQLVDGGSGGNGQMPGILTFGLGDFTGSFVSVQVFWPDGSSTTDVAAPLNSVIEVHDDHDPDLDTAAIGFVPVTQPGGLVDWVFTWYTHNSSDKSLDRVEILAPSPMVLDPASAGVDQIYERSGDTYMHQLILRNQTCVPKTTVQYKVGSQVATAGHTREWSATQSYKLGICVQ